MVSYNPRPRLAWRLEPGDAAPRELGALERAPEGYGLNLPCDDLRIDLVRAQASARGALRDAADSLQWAERVHASTLEARQVRSRLEAAERAIQDALALSVEACQLAARRDDLERGIRAAASAGGDPPGRGTHTAEPAPQAERAGESGHRARSRRNRRGVTPDEHRHDH